MLYKLSWTKIVWEDSLVWSTRSFDEEPGPVVKVDSRDQNETLIVEEEDFSGSDEDEAAMPYDGKICKHWIEKPLPFALTWSNSSANRSQSGNASLSVSHTSYVVRSIVPFVEKRAREE